MRQFRSWVVLATAGVLLGPAFVVGGSGEASAAPDPTAVTAGCEALADPVYQVVRPEDAVSLVTSSSREAERAARYGFVDHHDEVFRASTTPGPGLVPANRLFRRQEEDFLTTSSPSEVASATGGAGYQDQGVSFYVSAVPDDCLAGVYRYLKNGRHRLALTRADRNALAADGWESEGIQFYAAAPSSSPDPEPAPAPPAPAGPGTFTFAIMPDTQQEVLRSNDTRFLDRTRWLVSQESALNLKFVGHSGDVVNWDTPDHAQYQVASQAMKPLEEAGIPYSLSIGNHDTQATGVGGSARQPDQTRALQRDTSTFNAYFTASRYTRVEGAYETNRVDNIYSTFEAGDVDWLVLTLELWPRKSVLDWAERVVAEHPHHNVIITTHNYLDGGPDIAQSKEYGDTSPQYLYDHLVSQYANIRFVFCGHVGIAANREDTGVHGNKIYSYEETFHSLTENPVRLVQVDTSAHTVRSWIYAPNDGHTFSEYSTTQHGMTFVR